MNRSPVALVTGGTRGIGLGIARALARRGWRMALCGIREATEVRGVVEELTSDADQVIYVRADISSASDRQTLVEDVTTRFGGIDALVNNAGRAPSVRADILDATEQQFGQLLATNLQGPYFLSQAVARAMLARGSSSHPTPRSIVFITSVSADAASVNRGDYCVSKAGLSMAAKLFAARLAADGIGVFEVRPGIIDTDMTANVRDVYDQKIAQGLIPANRWGTADDVGGVVASLVSGEFRYATGSVVHVDGGLHLPRL